MKSSRMQLTLFIVLFVAVLAYVFNTPYAVIDGDTNVNTESDSVQLMGSATDNQGNYWFTVRFPDGRVDVVEVDSATYKYHFPFQQMIPIDSLNIYCNE